MTFHGNTGRRNLNSNISTMESTMRQVQEEVVRLNELGMELFQLGKLKTAAFHFNLALQGLKEISVTKKALADEIVTNLPHPSASFPTGTMVKKACQPLPLDSMSSPLCLHWEKIGSMAIIHNSALVHMQAQRYQNAKHLLELAITMMKREIRDVELNHLLSQSKYSASVVVSVYITLGKTLSRMMMFQPPHINETCEGEKSDAGLSAQTKKAFQVATGLMTRYLSKKKHDTSLEDKPKPGFCDTNANSTSNNTLMDVRVLAPSSAFNKSVPRKSSDMFFNSESSGKVMLKSVNGGPRTGSSLPALQATMSTLQLRS